MSSEIKVTNIKHASSGSNNLVLASDGNVSLSGTLSAGTLNSSVVFPAGHIIQSVYSPTITNTDTGAKTSDTAIADVINQITITSGNGVAIYCSAWNIASANSNAYGSIAIKEGTVASPSTELFRCHYGAADGYDNYAQESFWAYDSTPASTTPSYCVSINKGSANTTSVMIYSFASTYFELNLFEVQQ